MIEICLNMPTNTIKRMFSDFEIKIIGEDKVQIPDCSVYSCKTNKVRNDYMPYLIVKQTRPKVSEVFIPYKWIYYWREV